MLVLTYFLALSTTALTSAIFTALHFNKQALRVGIEIKSEAEATKRLAASMLDKVGELETDRIKALNAVQSQVQALETKLNLVAASLKR